MEYELREIQIGLIVCEFGLRDVFSIFTVLMKPIDQGVVEHPIAGPAGTDPFLPVFGRLRDLDCGAVVFGCECFYAQGRGPVLVEVVVLWLCESHKGFMLRQGQRRFRLGFLA